MLNNVSIMGRLVRDPELRYTGDNSDIPVLGFSIAVDRSYGEDETDFIDCVAWRKNAESISKHFEKGRPIIVTGSLQARRWTDKDGNRRRNVEVVVDQWYFADSKRDDSSSEK